jgi:predicted transcriptional regulator
MLPNLSEDMEIHKRLQIIFKYKGLKIRAVARNAGYPEKIFYRMIQGKKVIGIDDLKRIASAIDIPITYFFNIAE